MAYQSHTSREGNDSEENGGGRTTGTSSSNVIPSDDHLLHQVSMNYHPQDQLSVLMGNAATTMYDGASTMNNSNSTWPQAASPSGHVAQPQEDSVSRPRRHHHSNLHRVQSKPIAIIRPITGENNHAESGGVPFEDNDLDSDCDEAVTAAAGVATTSSARVGHHHHHSLPSRLLRAPFLGSVPTNEEYLMQRNLLPPPMRLSDNDDGVNEDQSNTLSSRSDHGVGNVNYGSLRESHIQGRFLDRPAPLFQQRGANGSLWPDDSFLQPIHSSGNMINSGDINMSTSAPSSGLSIGERIQQQRKLQQKLRNKSSNSDTGQSTSASNDTTATTTAHSNDPHMSSLAAMIEAASVGERNQHEPLVNTNFVRNDYQLHETGFSGSNPTIDATIHPLGDRNEHVTLSSSLTGLQILQHGLPRRMCAVDAPSPIVGPLSTNHEPYNFLSGMNSFSSSAMVESKQLPSTPAAPFANPDLGTDSDPDTDGAFDFDME